MEVKLNETISRVSHEAMLNLRAMMPEGLEPSLELIARVERIESLIRRVKPDGVLAST